MQNIFSLIAVAVSLFLMPACSSSDQESNGGGAGSHGDKPSAVQKGCNGKAAGCIRYEYNSHGDVEKYEECSDVTCQQWCDAPFLSYCLTYEYDARGRIEKQLYYSGCGMSNPDPICSVYTYDEHGNWVTRKSCMVSDPGDTCRELTYDSQGRIYTQFEYYCESKAGECATFTYDDQGRIVTEQTASDACGNNQNSTCIKYEYEGDTVMVYFVGDGNCENIGNMPMLCWHYIY